MEGFFGILILCIIFAPLVAIGLAATIFIGGIVWGLLLGLGVLLGVIKQ